MNSGWLVRSRSSAHKKQSLSVSIEKPLLHLGPMAAATYRYHPVGDLEPETAQADTLWQVTDLNTDNFPAGANRSKAERKAVFNTC